MRRFALLIPLGLAATGGSVAADELQLADGRVLVGAVETRGNDYRVRTRDGVVTVPMGDVVRHRTDDDLRAALSALAERVGDDGYSRVQLARTAFGWGLDDEMWEHLDAAVERTRPRSAGDKALRSLLAELEPALLPAEHRDADPEVRVRQLLLRLRPGSSPAKQAVVQELLAREPDADALLRTKARVATRPLHRAAAVHALARREAEGNDTFVFRSLVMDGSQDVRDAAARATLRSGQREQAVQYIAGGLMHDHPEIRGRTAHAMANLGSMAAVPLLVAAGPLAGTPRASLAEGGGERGHVAFIEQTSFIRDFDVEVAQASFIADPKVDVLQSGTVLDVSVHAVTRHRTEIVRAYRRALHHLTGSDPGNRTAKWAEWMQQLKPRQAAATTAARTAQQ